MPKRAKGNGQPHGGRRTPTLDHIVIDRGAQVADDAQAIRDLRQRVPVVAFVNNHYAGYAPETVRQLVALIDAVTGQRRPP
jgi:hypothetical protein